MRVSLRSVISVVSAVSVATVAAITLGMTLTTSLAALRSVGTGHAEALLRAAQISSEGLFNVPQVAVETVQAEARGNDWEWPANSAAVRSQWALIQDMLLLQSQGRLHSLLLYFRDNSEFVALALAAPGSEVLVPAPYVGSAIVYGAPVNSSDPMYSATGYRNQTSMPTEYTVRHTGNRSVVPETAPNYRAIMPTFEHSNFAGEGLWANSLMLPTGGGRTTVNAGVYTVSTFGTVHSFIPFIGALHRRGEVPGVVEPYGFVIAALLIDELAQFLRDTKATPSTLAVATDRLGYLLATSEPDRAISTSVRAPPGTTLQTGCSATENSGTASSDPDNYVTCRLRAIDFGNAPLTALVGRPELAFAAQRRVEIVDTESGFVFAATAPVRLRYSGLSVHLILLIPERDIIGDVVRSRNVAIGVTAAVFVLAAAATFAAIALLLTPLGPIADRMSRAARLEDDAADTALSAMDEVAAIQEAYYAMNAELNRVRSFVPQSVLMANKAVAGSAASGDDDEDDEGELDTTAYMDAATDGGDALNRSGDVLNRSGRSGGGTHRSSHRTSRGGAGSAPSATAPDGLAPRVVAVLVANVHGFSTALTTNTADASRACTALAGLVEIVESSVVANGGVLGGFHGDHFTATFNAVRPCGAGPRRASATALALAQWRGTEAGMQFKVGVAAGKCLVGNAGTASVKAFSVIGPAFAQAVVLERLSRLYGPECNTLVTNRVSTDTATHYRFRVVDHVLLPPRHPTLVAALLGANSGPSGDQPHTPAKRDNQDEEWLYTVGAQDASDPNAAHNAAFAGLARADVAACERYAGASHTTAAAAAVAAEKPRMDSHDVSAMISSGSTASLSAQRLRDLIAALTPDDAAANRGPVSDLGFGYEAHLRGV